MGYAKLRQAFSASQELVCYMHESIASPALLKSSGSKEPTPHLHGNAIINEYTLDNDASYRFLKIPVNAITGTIDFHVHWTKSQDTDQSNKNVKWKISWHQIDGETEDIAATNSNVFYTGTYLDNGTTTHICYEIDSPANSYVALIPGNYLTFKIEAVTPDSNTLDEPGLISVDMTWQEYRNKTA